MYENPKLLTQEVFDALQVFLMKAEIKAKEKSKENPNILSFDMSDLDRKLAYIRHEHKIKEARQTLNRLVFEYEEYREYGDFEIREIIIQKE